MLVKYWKNFKWFLFIPLIAFVFVFKINSVKAYTIKRTLGEIWWDNRSYNINNLTNGNSTYSTFILHNAINNTEGYRYFAFQVSRKYRIQTNLHILPYDYECQYWNYTASTGQYTCGNMQTYGVQISSSGMGYFNSGSIGETYYVYDSDNHSQYCFTSSEYEDYVICPISSTIKKFEVYIYNNGFDSVNGQYVMGYSGFFLNDDSFEISGALGDIQTQQQTTNTNLQYIYQYQQNDSVSGSTTQVQGDFTDLAQSFNSELQGVNDLSQLVLMPISLFMDLSTDNCQPLHLQIPYVNMSVDLPCMKAIFNQYFNGLYSIFTTIMSAVICYWVAIKTGALVKEIVDCDNDRIEVVDL